MSAVHADNLNIKRSFLATFLLIVFSGCSRNSQSTWKLLLPNA